jgi:hypothetical protein
MYLEKFLEMFSKDSISGLKIIDRQGMILYEGKLSEMPDEVLWWRKVVPGSVSVSLENITLQVIHLHEIEQKYQGHYLPQYDPEWDAWFVDTFHGVEWGCVEYVVGEFCGDNTVYRYQQDSSLNEEHDHVHVFAELLENILKKPSNVNIEKYQDEYSEQEWRVISGLKKAIILVQENGRPLSRKEQLEL